MDTKEQVAVLEAARLINDFAVLPRAVVFEKYGIKTEEQRRFQLAAASGRVLEFVTGRINEMADMRVDVDLRKGTMTLTEARTKYQIKPGKNQKKTAKRRGRPPKPRPAGGEEKKSGHKGVYWDYRKGKWRVMVTVGGKTKYGGLFDIDDELAAAAKAAELRGNTKEAEELEVQTAKEKTMAQMNGEVNVIWQCRGCGFDVSDDPTDRQCPKCNGTSFERIPQPKNPRTRKYVRSLRGDKSK